MKADLGDKLFRGGGKSYIMDSAGILKRECLDNKKVHRGERDLLDGL